jgi:hypothetical protein
MHTRPPDEVASQIQSKGQSFAVAQAFVQMNDGLVPKQSRDWQSLSVEQFAPRSEKAQVAAAPPPAPLVPPPLPDEHVEGPALLPPEKPPPEVPRQHVAKFAQAPGHERAPSRQRLFTQRRELTGGPEAQSQYQ